MQKTQGRPLARSRLLALPRSILMNESITRVQKNIEGTETEKCERVLPGYKDEGKQEVYIVSERTVDIIRSMQNRNECEFFREYVDSGRIIRYLSPKQVEKEKTKKAKVAIACGVRR